MTAKYIAETNELQELSDMQPPRPPMNGIHDYYWDIYLKKRMAHDKHVASLRLIPCDPSCREVFKDNQEYEEGRDYEVRNVRQIHWPSDMVSYPSVAFPLPVKSDDDLWDELFEYMERYYNGGHPDYLEAKKVLSNSFSLTKR